MASEKGKSSDNTIMRHATFALALCLLFSLLSGAHAQSGDSEKQFKDAEKYFFQKQYGAAKSALMQVVSANPSHPKAYSYLGDIALNVGDYREALRYYQAAERVSPEPAKECFRMGQVYIEMKQPDQAIEQFSRAYSLSPNLKAALYQNGYVYLVFKRDKYQTISYWKHFLAEAPSDPQYENIRKVIALLEDENFVLPPVGSDVSLEEALRLGGKTLQADGAEALDRSAGHEKERTRTDTEGLLDSLEDDDL